MFDLIVSFQGYVANDLVLQGLVGLLALASIYGLVIRVYDAITDRWS